MLWDTGTLERLWLGCPPCTNADVLGLVTCRVTRGSHRAGALGVGAAEPAVCTALYPENVFKIKLFPNEDLKGGSTSLTATETQSRPK